MNNISSLQQTGSQTENSKNTFTQTLGKDDFLTLLVTQLKNQDPMKPMDPTQFTAQLAQFSSLEQLYNINESLQALESVQGGVDRLSALSMIDKYVVSGSSTFQYKGEAMELGFSFQEEVRDATIHINTLDGQTIHKIPVENLSYGETFIQWDGKNIDGHQLPEGTYGFTVTGTTEEGKSIAGSTLVKSRINGVDFSGPETILITTNGTVKLSDISKVNNLTFTDNVQ